MLKKVSGLICILFLAFASVRASSLHYLITPTPTPEVPDLTVTSMRYTLDPNATCMYPGITSGTLVTIANTGTQAAESFRVSLMVSGQSYSQTVSSLAANATTGVWFDGTGWPMEQITATADDLQQVSEANEVNNSLTQQLPIPTPYVTCTPTTEPTDEPTTELLLNGGFELAGENDRLADDWMAGTLSSKDRRVCNALLAHRGSCAFRFKGAVNRVRKITQRVALTENMADATLQLEGWAKAKNLTRPARLNVIVRYTDESFDQLNMPLTTGTYEYRHFEEQLALDGEVAKVTVSLFSGRSGLLLVDDVRLSLLDGTPEPNEPQVSITTDKTTVNVGETITVSVTLHNLEIPVYSLKLSSGAITHVTGGSDILGELGKDAIFEVISATATDTSAEFVLKAVGVGTADAYVVAYGEVFEGFWHTEEVSSQTIQLTAE